MSVVLGVVAAPAGFAVFWLVARVELPWQLVVSPPVPGCGRGRRRARSRVDLTGELAVLEES
jgi:hypothetical protein